MKFYGLLAVLLALFLQAQGVRRITLDDDSQALCKKYKMMCKTDKICAVQHFDWPSNITIPVCIPLSFVPVRNRICKLPPDTGRCLARYIRWYYNIHSQECTHFQYGGCEGNQNNFMSKTECERTCISTPSIRLYEGQSALVQPSIMTAPVYEPLKVDARVEGLNSAREEPVSSGNFDRYEVRRRPNKSRNDEASITRTRRRLDKEREKERKRREKKKEKKRLKKLRREQKKLRCKKRRERGKKCKRDRKGSKKRKSNKKKTSEKSTEVENETAKENNEVIKVESGDKVDETKNIINNEIDEVEEADDTDDKEKDKKRDKRRKKRKLRDKRRHETDRSRRNLNSRKSRKYSEYSKRPETYSKKLFSILDRDRQYVKQENSLIHTLS